MSKHTYCEEISPNVQPKPPLALYSHPGTCCLGEQAKPHLATTFFQVVVENDKVITEPPLLQAKQLQLPQPLLTELSSIYPLDTSPASLPFSGKRKAMTSIWAKAPPISDSNFFCNSGVYHNILAIKQFMLLIFSIIDFFWHVNEMPSNDSPHREKFYFRTCSYSAS